MSGRATLTEGIDDQNRVIAPVPRVTIQAFCETPGVAEVIEAAAGDRRMQKAHIKIQMGGGPAAVEAYRHAPTPNVVVLESHGERSAILGHLDSLAEVCDEGTKVIVVGHVNDVVLYRDLTRRGVSEYLIAPIAILDFVRAVSELFTTVGADPIGRTIAVVGAKGGVGASTIAHNRGGATTDNQTPAAGVVILNTASGPAPRDLNQAPPQSVAEAIFA